MGKKNKQPNAPLLQQPPQNPYYPSLSDLSPPPPYSDLSAAREHPHHHQPTSFAMSSRPGTAVNYPRERPANVIVHQPISLQYDHQATRRHQKVRSFNNEVTLAALIIIGLALWSRSLYEHRPCLDTLVHQPNKELSITIFMVRDMHCQVVMISIFILIIALAKSASGQSKSYACYLLLMNISLLVATCFTGYLAYLAFYSPCTTNVGELAASSIKTILGKFVDSLPSPDKKFFAESNVLELKQEDPNGFLIFLFDILSFALYLGGLITGLVLC